MIHTNKIITLFFFFFLCRFGGVEDDTGVLGKDDQVNVMIVGNPIVDQFVKNEKEMEKKRKAEAEKMEIEEEQEDEQEEEDKQEKHIDN